MIDDRIFKYQGYLDVDMLFLISLSSNVGRDTETKGIRAREEGNFFSNPNFPFFPNHQLCIFLGTRRDLWMDLN